MSEFRPVGFGWGDWYEVNADGIIRRKGSTRPIGSKSGKGYVRVQFSRGSYIETHLAHKIVADVFIGPRPNGYHIDHINNVKHDNRAVNLRYCTAAENNSFKVEHGTEIYGERNAAAALTDEQAEIIRQRKAAGGRYWGRAELAAELGVDISTVRRAANGKTHIAAAIRAKIPSGNDPARDDTSNAE